MLSAYIDEPLKNEDDDKLGVKKELLALSEFIMNCQTPMTIAIQGDWGTGKTSMMNMVLKNIQNQCVCVWFNTWQFSQFQMQNDVPLALMSELLETVADGDTKSIKEKFFGLSKRVATAAGSFADTMLPGSGKAINAFIQEDLVDIATQLKQLKEKFNEVIENKLKKTNKDRLVVFVDDLDRMNPSKAVELLEVIKIFLDIKGCVFVLAVDYGVVSRGVQEKYGKDMDEIKGRSFFDKIIQLPFNLPVANYTIGKYLESLFHIPKEDINLYKKLASSSVGTNPRTLKRMANIMSLLEIVAKYEDEPRDITPQYRILLFAVLCLQMAFETVYSQLLIGDVRKNLFEVKNDELLNIFSEALEKAPGKKEDLQKKLVRFFNNLNEILSNMDENSWEQFSEVLNKSGIAASGSQQPLMATEAIKETFDPFLIANFAQLPEIINEKYKDYFDLVEVKAGISVDDPTKLSIPLIFARSIDFYCNLGEEGINLGFWTEEKSTVKKTFKILLEENDIKLPAKLISGKGVAKCFLTVPTIPWVTPLTQKGRSASIQRYEQIKNLLDQWCTLLLPVLRNIYIPKAEVLKKIDALVEQIEDNFKKYLPENKGWIYWRGDFGFSLFPDWGILCIRKAEWDEDFEIQLRAEDLWSNSMYIGFTQSYNEKYDKDKNVNAFYNLWKKEMESTSNFESGDIQQSEDWACYVYLPEELRDWTEDSFDDPNFKFNLDNKQETQVIEFCDKCAQSFLVCESQMDMLAKEN